MKFWNSGSRYLLGLTRIGGPAGRGWATDLQFVRFMVFPRLAAIGNCGSSIKTDSGL